MLDTGVDGETVRQDTVGESTQYNDVINSNTEKVKISSKDGVLLN